MSLSGTNANNNSSNASKNTNTETNVNKLCDISPLDQLKAYCIILSVIHLQEVIKRISVQVFLNEMILSLGMRLPWEMHPTPLLYQRRLDEQRRADHPTSLLQLIRQQRRARIVDNQAEPDIEEGNKKRPRRN